MITMVPRTERTSADGGNASIGAGVGAAVSAVGTCGATSIWKRVIPSISDWICSSGSRPVGQADRHGRRLFANAELIDEPGAVAGDGRFKRICLQTNDQSARLRDHRGPCRGRNLDRRPRRGSNSVDARHHARHPEIANDEQPGSAAQLDSSVVDQAQRAGEEVDRHGPPAPDARRWRRERDGPTVDRCQRLIVETHDGSTPVGHRQAAGQRVLTGRDLEDGGDVVQGDEIAAIGNGRRDDAPAFARDQRERCRGRLGSLRLGQRGQEEHEDGWKEGGRTSHGSIIAYQVRSFGAPETGMDRSPAVR